MNFKKISSLALCALCVLMMLASCTDKTPSLPVPSPIPSETEDGSSSIGDVSSCAHTNTQKASDQKVSCTVDGYEDMLKCKDCGDLLTHTGQIIPAKGHQYKNRKCSYCGKFEPDLAVEGSFEGTKIYWKLYTDGELEIGGNGATPDFDLKENSYFYRYNKAVTSIVIYNGVTRIGDGLCRVLKEAKTISISSSVTEIGDHAFEGWELTTLHLPLKLKSLGADNFTCNKLFFLDLPSGLESIGSGCFESTQLITIRVPSSIKRFETVEGQFQNLENIAFSGSKEQVRSLSIYKHLKTDGKCALLNVYYDFKDSANSLPYCTKRGQRDGDFTYIVYSDKTARISAYSGISKDLVIPETVGGYTVTGIHTTCFEENSNIAKVTLPKTLKTIGREAFVGSTLSSLVILGDELRVADFAFSNCTSLTYLEMNGSFLDVGHGAFAATHVSNLKISLKADAVRDSAFAQSEIKISDFTQFEYIGASAFAYTSLSCNVNLKGVKEIGFGAFYRAGVSGADVTGVSVIEGYAFNLNGGLSKENVVGLSGVPSVAETAFDFKL